MIRPKVPGDPTREVRSFPLGEPELAAELLQERWSLEPDEGVWISGKIVGQRVFVSLRLENPDREETLTIEVQVMLSDFDDEEQARHLGYDALDALLGEYLEADRAYFFPIDWTEAEFNGKEVAYRGQLRRYALEEEADRIIGSPRGHDQDP